jgi:peptidyl-prolyl cis-trans isomerase B (cyclophilin B)
VEPLQTEQQPKGGGRTGVVIGVVAAVLVLLAGATIVGVYMLHGALQPDASAQTCRYQKSPEPAARDVGIPPAEAKGGSRTVTIDSSIGTLELELDKAAPCTGRSFAFLADKKYFNGTSCHRLTDQGIFVLQCGDPSGSGAGGPGYQFGTENLPIGKSDPYPAGTLAMARAQDPNSNGSQFFIVYGTSELSPDYTVFGKVTGGLDAIKKAAAAGHDGSLDQIAGGGKPKTPVTFSRVAVE